MKKQYSVSNCMRSFTATIVLGLLIFAWDGAPAMAQSGTAPICPSGYAYNSGTKKCEATQTAFCPSGTTDIGNGKCKKTAEYTCPSGYHLGWVNQVYTCAKAPFSSSPGPFTVDFVCPQGFTKGYYICTCLTYDNPCSSKSCSGDKCIRIIPMVCHSGFTLRTTDNICMSQKTPSCLQGYSFKGQVDRCIIMPGKPQ
jgi:hypothetical protein